MYDRTSKCKYFASPIEKRDTCDEDMKIIVAMSKRVTK